MTTAVPQWIRALGRTLTADLNGDESRLDTGVAVVLLVGWSYVLFWHLPLQFTVEGTAIHLDTAAFAAGSHVYVLVGLAGTISAWGFLCRRMWGYLGTLVLTGLWLAPVPLGPQVFLFVVFWYLLWISPRVVG